MATVISVVMTQQGKRLDEIVFERYGNLELFDAIVALNRDIVQDVFVEQGAELLMIELPYSTAPKIQEASTLW
jgi:hypothetical protein